MPLVALQPPALDRLRSLEEVILKGRSTFVEVGMAISEIKERKLYLNDFETFEEWCQARYGWTRQHATGLANAANAVKSLPAGTVTAVTANAAKALSKVPENLRKAVVEKASEGGKPPTAKNIKAATPKSSGPPPKKKKTPATPAKEKHLDATGLVIPEALVMTWERRDEAQELLTYLSAIRGKLKSVQEAQDLLYAEVDFSGTLAHLDMAFSDLKRAKPFAICPTCQGKLPKDCTGCKGRGFVSEFYWNTCVPGDVREMRKKVTDEQNA